MKVKIKKLVPEAVIPKYAHVGDVGQDLTAISKTTDEYGNIVYGTGLAFEIPEGYFMMLHPRSSNHKMELLLTNHCGIVDSGYRGEVFFKYARTDKRQLGNLGFMSSILGNKEYQIGDRIGQLIILPYPSIEFEETDELSASERGDNGYGSTGQ